MNYLKLQIVGLLCIGLLFTAKSQTREKMYTPIESNGLRSTIYKVDDLRQAKAWYSKAFGVEPYYDQMPYVGFNIGGYELGLFQEKVSVPKTSNVLSYWAVDDITDAYDIMISHGAKELETPNDVGDGIKVALVKDPWENVIGLIYNPHFEAEKRPAATVIEWAPFTLKPDITEAELLAQSSRLEKEFLTGQEGYIKRELLKKSDREWIDLVYWENQQAADSAVERANESAVCLEFFSLMEFVENAGSGIEHFELVSEY